MPCYQPLASELTVAVGLNAMQAPSGGFKTGTLSHVRPSAAQTLLPLSPALMETSTMHSPCTHLPALELPHGPSHCPFAGLHVVLPHGPAPPHVTP